MKASSSNRGNFLELGGGICLVNKSVLMFHLDLKKERRGSHKKKKKSGVSPLQQSA